MTQTRDLIKKMADFFASEDFCEKGEDARLELSTDDVRCMNEVIKTCGDAISRQAVLAILKDKWNMFSDANDAIQESIDTIEAIPSVTPQQTTGQWIPVSERLPEENGRYVVHINAKVPLIQIIPFAKNLHEISLDFTSKKAGWYDYDSEYGFFERTGIEAWMPLPEPYKAESEDKE